MAEQTTVADDAFAGAGAKNGIEIWRIENKQPVAQPEDTYGKFHVGDSYIVLHTKEKKFNLHFWLGNETSVDEMGIAAYKTVELDDYINNECGGDPVQYRETQGKESNLFQAYFKNLGMEYKPGGVDSGFNKVDRDHYEPRLLHLKGKRSVRCTEVEKANTSLNTGDVFILDLGLKLFIWNGKDASRQEKIKGTEMIIRIKDSERGGKAEMIIMDDDPDNEEFWEALGGKIDVTDPGEDDEKAEKAAAENVVLYIVSDKDGTLRYEEVDKDDKGQLHREMLVEDDVALLDADTEIFVWIGKGASPAEKKEGMIRAQTYLVEAEKDPRTPITRMVSGAENAIFKSWFFQWEKFKVPDFSRKASTGVAAAEQQEINFEDLHAKKEAASREKTLPEGGTTTIWRIENMEKVEVPAEQYGQFYGGDSYIILYKYESGGREEAMIYFWQGRASSQDEKGASALLAKDLDDEMGGFPAQCRVEQGKEPAHFRELFKGKMVVHTGGKASGFKNSSEGDSYDEDGVSLYHVRGTDDSNTYGVQVAEEAKNFSSGDCFVLLTPKTMYNWQGGNSSDSEKTVALAIAELLKDVPPGNREVETVAEGEETEEFWGFLGGKAEYPKEKQGDAAPQDPRLFQMTNVTGAFVIDEVFDFAQTDLIDDDVMLLDTYSTVFLWVGSQANEQEKRMSIETAQKFVASASDGRDPGTPIISVSAGKEPALFTCNFLGWDAGLFEANKFVDPYEARLAKMREQSKAAPAASWAKPKAELEEDEPAPAPAPSPSPAPEPAPAPAPAPAADVPYDASTTHPLEDLASGTPAGVDPAKKELHLSDADFQSAFGMSLSEFQGLAKWKQTAAKKKVGIF